MANILIVESDDDTRAILRMALEYAGHTVTGYGDAKQALALMRCGKAPLLVLLGLSLDSIGNNPVIKAIEADPSLATSHRVLVFTPRMADQAQEEMQHVRSCIAGVLPTPFDLSDLLGMVARVAARASLAVTPEPIPWDQPSVAQGHPASPSTGQTHLEIHHLVGRLSNSNARISSLLHHVAQLAAPARTPAQELATRCRRG